MNREDVDFLLERYDQTDPRIQRGIVVKFLEMYAAAQARIDELEKPPADDRAIWNLVIADMRERNRIGTIHYGKPLTANNGRYALRDAYEEALDLAAYLKQAMVERDAILIDETTVARINFIANKRFGFALPIQRQEFVNEMLDIVRGYAERK